MSNDSEKRPDQASMFDGLQDLMKKTLGVGGVPSRDDVRGFFKEMLPKNISEFVAMQIDTFRSEVSTAVQHEISALVSGIDAEKVIKLLEGRKIRIRAEIEIPKESPRRKRKTSAQPA